MDLCAGTVVYVNDRFAVVAIGGGVWVRSRFRNFRDFASRLARPKDAIPIRLYALAILAAAV